MTLQTYEANLLAHEHARVRRTMRLMTTSTSLKTNGRVFEGKRSAQIAVTFEAGLFIGRDETHHARAEAAVGIVAVHARHRAFWNPMPVRALELGKHIGVARAALLIDGGGLPGYQAIGAVSVHAVARRAGHRVFGVAALHAADLRGAVQMALEAIFIDGRGIELHRVDNVRGREGIGMLAAGTVAGLASLALPFGFDGGFDGGVRALQKRFVDIFMARAASLGTHVGLGGIRTRGRGWSCGRGRRRRGCWSRRRRGLLRRGLLRQSQEDRPREGAGGGRRSQASYPNPVTCGHTLSRHERT